MPIKSFYPIIFVGLALLGSACFHDNEGLPNSYVDQVNTFSKTNTSTAGLVKRNFLIACSESFLSGDSVGSQQENYCQCVYKGAEALVDFDEFIKFSKDLKKDSRQFASTNQQLGTPQGNMDYIARECRTACKAGGNCRPPSRLPQLPTLPN